MTRGLRSYTPCQFSNSMSSSQFQCHRDVIDDTKLRIRGVSVVGRRGSIPGFMHTSLCVIGVLPDLVVNVVLSLGFCRWAAAQAVHEPSVSDVPSSRTFGSGTPIGTAWRELTESAPIRPQ